jgi:dsRNA-specific ribonuclease
VPSSNCELRLPQPSPKAQSSSHRQLLQQRLRKYQWSFTFSVDCSGPQHAQLWKVSFLLGSAMIGESTWFTNKDAAKENAAMQALAWLNTHYPQSPPSRTTVPLSNYEVQTASPPPPPSSVVQRLSNRQLLQERLQKYQWKATFSIDCNRPQHAQLLKVSFFVGTTMIGESTLFRSKDAAKEDAAKQAISWLNIYGYP